MTKLSGDEPAFPKHKRHYMHMTPTYQSWLSMLARCTRKTHKSYPEYGGRGITVPKKWLTFTGFYEDMGQRPINTSLDRIDNNASYSRPNCRWATAKEQAKNRRQPYDGLDYRGIIFKRNRWVAQFKTGGVNYFLGSYNDKDTAFFAYLLAVQWFRPEWIDTLINKGASDER